MKRIQRRRTKGYRLPPDAVYVGRPTRWGNDARAGDCAECRWGQHDGEHRPMTAADAVEDYRIGWEAMTAAEASIGRMTPEEIRQTGVSGVQVDLFADIRGHDLACWCPEACGEDVDLGWGEFGGPYDPCALPRGHAGHHDPSAPTYCHADVLLELANR